MSAEEVHFGRVVRLFYWYRLISRFYLYLPVMVVFLLDRKLTYLESGAVLAAYGFAVMASKPVVARIVRIWPKKAVLFVGEWLKCLGIVGLVWSGESVAALIVSQALIGFGFSCSQGTDSLLLSHWTEKYRANDAYSEIEAKSQSYIFLAVLVSGVAGAVLAEIDLRLPFYLTVPFNFAASWLVLGFVEESTKRPDVSALSEPESKTAGDEGVSGLWRLAHVISFYAVNRATIMAYYVLVFPLFLFVRAHVSVGYFGILLGLFSLSAFLSGRWLGAFSRRFGEKTVWAAVPSALLVSSILLLSDAMWAFWIVPALLGLAAGTVRPLVYGFLKKEAGALKAAAVSAAEFWFAWFNAGFLLAIAALFEWSVRGGLCIVMAVLFLLSVWQAAQWKRSGARPDTAKV
ncbi:major facilitator superfamily MFS_1 [Kyrpidia tusciae DSM 2912]|uniref:Major facilitator superfamily MFS_1 n=1 Tax=Kyrpidia tusciae (strain DSM 2912 / NBRC 15312 / T2) TaxID=562970 RepID=D5WRU5_KYRT2|nr:major facilitator superfamily MFS_1 [Kyrpidia tusciae DSM 2912]